MFFTFIYFKFIQIGSSVTLNLGEKKSPNIWKLDSSVDEELINEDDLLDESDIIKPVINLKGKLNTLYKLKKWFYHSLIFKLN